MLLCWRMLVGAPWDGPPNNRKGDVYKCVVGEEKNSNCIKVNLGKRQGLPWKCIHQMYLLPDAKLVYLSVCQVNLLSRTYLKTWGILTWEWLSRQTHLMASWYVASTPQNKAFYFCYVATGVVCGSWKGCGETRLCLFDRIWVNQLRWCVFIWLKM